MAVFFSIERVSIMSFAFGAEFSKAASLVLVLALAKVCQSISNATSGFLLMTGQESRFAKITTVAMVINISGNAVLIPTHGAVGAAVATCLSAFTLAATQLWASKTALLEYENALGRK